MRQLAIAFALLAGALCAPAQAADERPAPLKCDIGPATKTFGKQPWLVYACADGRSLVVVSAPGNPLMPLYFFYFSKEGRYELVGEGTGSKAATSAAFADLSALSEAEIANLLAEAQAAHR